MNKYNIIPMCSDFPCPLTLILITYLHLKYFNHIKIILTCLSTYNSNLKCEQYESYLIRKHHSLNQLIINIYKLFLFKIM